MKTPSHTGRRARGLVTLGLVAAIVLPWSASAHPIDKFWRYGKDVRTHTWRQHDGLVKRHERWHRRHPDANRWHHRRFHHRRLVHPHRNRHKFRIVARESGQASYFSGRIGACGRALTGLYAAHKSWPCGTKVSVRRGGRYVIVRVLDRGPHTPGRVIDLSPAAFERIGPLSSGVLSVRIYRLKKR